MSTPYDLDSSEPGERPASNTQGGQSPPITLQGTPSHTAEQAPRETRASDILRDHPSYGANQTHRLNNVNGGERAATKFDDVARGIFFIALLVAAVSLGYLLYGLWGGMLADPNYSHYLTKADHLRIASNIGTMAEVLRVGLFVTLIAFLFLFYHEESAGYILILLSLFFFLGVPFITAQILGMSRQIPSHMTRETLEMIRAIAWMPGVPGSLLIVYDIYRRITGGLEEAQIRRATLRYGQGVARQSKHRNVFLGACWNTPFCRDSIRAKCPIFVQKKGPCWRHKRGCMCEESIILQAQAGDWKQRVAGAVNQMEGKSDVKSGLLGGGGPPPMVLNMEQKKERCRQCVIYNKHEEQKYKVLVAATFVFVFGLVALLKTSLAGVVSTVSIAANSVLLRFSYNAAHTAVQSSTPIISPDLNGPLVWVVLGVGTLIILSKLLQLVEYCCFKIKI